MIGEYYNMPNSPDLNVKRTVIFDKVDIKKKTTKKKKTKKVK